MERKIEQVCGEDKERMVKVDDGERRKEDSSPAEPELLKFMRMMRFGAQVGEELTKGKEDKTEEEVMVNSSAGEAEEIKVDRFTNVVDVGAFPELEDCKMELHPGLCIEHIMDQIDTLSTIGEIVARGPEEYLQALVHNVRSAYDLVGMLEHVIMGAWASPQHHHEDAAIDMIEEIVVKNSQEVNMVSGWRFTILDRVGGQGMVIDLRERFTLL